MPLSALDPIPDPVVHADALVASVDACLAAGFARLGSDQRAGLASLARAFAGTPLAEPVAAATKALSGGGAREDHLVALAAARESLLGAAHDALLAQACAALDGAVAAPAEAAAAGPGDAPAELAGFMSSTRQWLVEVALAGLGQLDSQTVLPFAATLAALQAQPALARLAALLTGFVDELDEHVPTAAMSDLPTRRWADLWSRALLGAYRLAPAPAQTKVSGTLRVLGADLRHHDHAVSLVAYGLLDPGAGERLVRATVTAWKVDAVAGDEVWTALEHGAGPLLSALAEHKLLAIQDMTLLDSGDLVWGTAAKLGKAFDPMDAALAAFSSGAGVPIPLLPARDRHPVQLALPVAGAGGKLTERAGVPTLELAGATLPLAPTSPLLGLGPAELAKADQVFGLLRFDAGRWRLAPLLAKGKAQGKAQPGLIGPGASIARARKISKSARTLAILQERAGKLLRSS
ncbi:hypothetical protein [Haliangium sp.]|uniref:hypothetical protein n=1 Tax=Haliangium sp. TaxID=2663208 RepID=UPI003D0A7F3D